jgi:hypothetical protein
MQQFVYKWRLPWLARLNFSHRGVSCVLWLGWVGAGVSLNYTQTTQCKRGDTSPSQFFDLMKTTTSVCVLWRPNRNWIRGAVSFFGYAVAGKEHEVEVGRDFGYSRWLWENISC